MERLTKKQKQILNMLALPNARIKPPEDLPGRRNGFVTTNGSVSGYITGVSLKTFKAMKQSDLIFELHGHYYLKS